MKATYTESLVNISSQRSTDSSIDSGVFQLSVTSGWGDASPYIYVVVQKVGRGYTILNLLQA